MSNDAMARPFTSLFSLSVIGKRLGDIICVFINSWLKKTKQINLLDFWCWLTECCHWWFFALLWGGDPPGHRVVLGVNDCETFWGGIPGHHCKSANWCHEIPPLLHSFSGQCPVDFFFKTKSSLRRSATHLIKFLYVKTAFRFSN